MKSMRTAIIFTASALVLAACTETPVTHNTANHLMTEQQSYLTATPGEGKLTPERINASPSLSGPSLRKAAISPDGTMVTVLQGRDDDAQQQDLWAYDLDSGEGRLLVSSTDLLGAPEALSAEEANRRERAREYSRGIISYSWVGENLLMFPLGGDLYLFDLTTRKSRQVTATKGFETDPKVSRDGKFVAYVRDNNLFINELETGLERQLSDGATDLIRNATASFVVQEELDRATGYWMSPNASLIAYSQIDESPVAIENRIEFGADGIENVSQRYPFAGTDNATVKLGIVSRLGGKTTWVDIGSNPDIYLTRVNWSHDGSTLYAGVLSRDAKTHRFYKIDPSTGQSEIFFTETAPTWLNVPVANMLPLKDGSFLWQSERDGINRLYNVNIAGEFTAVSPEGLLVTAVNSVNTDVGYIYVTGWKDSALERHIFRISLKTGETIQISTGDGIHSASFNKTGTRYIGSYSADGVPTQTRAFEADGTPLAWLNKNALDETHPYSPYLDAHITPKYGQLTADDGQMMDYMLFKPKELKAGEKRATITLVYGGPGVQRVNKAWERKAFAQMLTQHGFVVFMMDNRGATGRGKHYEDGLYRSMGRSEVIDQSVGAEWLKSQDFVDPDRMGIYGWSYGGYLTLHMLAQTDHYASGVSGAPVTDWALYDTAYTERFLGSPVKGDRNYTEGAYENGSVFPYLKDLSAPILLIHGMADDNVVFRHSIKLMGEMQKNGQHNLRLMTYPGEKHGFRSEVNRTHRDRQILDFFLETLSTPKK